MMYVDKDSNCTVSIMELTTEQVYVLTEALVRYSTNPDIQVESRQLAKVIACKISSVDIKS